MGKKYTKKEIENILFENITKDDLIKRGRKRRKFIIEIVAKICDEWDISTYELNNAGVDEYT